MWTHQFKVDVESVGAEPVIEWCEQVGLDPFAIPLDRDDEAGGPFPVFYNAETGELEYSECNPRLALREVGQVITRKLITVDVPPPLDYFRPLP